LTTLILVKYIIIVPFVTFVPCSVSSQQQSASQPAAAGERMENKEPKFAIGTPISKQFVDPETNLPRDYFGSVTRFEFVQDRRMWLYYVHYPEDDDAEHLSEAQIAKWRIQ
jgi:hypothetical protein